MDVVEAVVDTQTKTATRKEPSSNALPAGTKDDHTLATCLPLALTIWAYPDQGTILVAKICPRKGIGQGAEADFKDVLALQGDAEKMK